jgi:hypothetical protein
MTDYTKPTGSSGTMMIRDTGTVVEFWLKAGSATYNHDLPWGYVINGVTSGTQYFDFVSGGSWQKLGGWNITYSQTVTFKLFATGTSGLGGPTTFSKTISRASVPAAPSVVSFANVGATSVQARFTYGANNGSAILYGQIVYGISSSLLPYQNAVTSYGSTNLSSLTQGATYYFWARCNNSVGWGPWSGRSSVTLLDVPDPPGPVTLTNVGQLSVHASFTDNSNNGSAILERRVEYGTDPGTPTAYASGNNVDISGLSPAVTYYFWSRSRNAVGWSPLSSVRSAMTVAGARVKVGTIWKQAIPYVKVDGVWTVARPWGKVAGVWKESS